jgi:CO/xanthine dehydrogenase Mo-binding subunit
MPGVRAILTGRDLVERGDLNPYFGPVFRDQPILAIDKVRYVGDPVAAVAATDVRAAHEAISLIDVEYDELPTVLDLDEALAQDAPLVHDEPPRMGATFADVILKPHAGTNLCNSFRLRKGDVEAGFMQADYVFEDVFTSPPVQHVPLETHACIADVTSGHVTVWSGAQIPFIVRSQLAEIFRVPQSRVRVIVPSLGGGFGGKCYPKIEPVTAALSLVAHRPVRLHLAREEEFVTITKHGVRIQLKTGLMADGRIIARQSICHFNTGAYADIGPRLIKNGGFGTAGPHNIPNIAVDSYAVYTTLPPAGAFRGYGISQAAWAYETQMDMIAERIGIDPLELRMRNLLEDGQTVMTGEPIEDAHFKEMLAGAAQWIGWRPDEGPVRSGTKVRAKGLSCIIKGTVTPSTSTAIAKLNEDGTLDVLTSSVEMGQGLQTALAILAGDALGLTTKRIQVSQPDTEVTPYDQQSSSSRSTYYF